MANLVIMKQQFDHGGEIMLVNDILFKKADFAICILDYGNYKHAFNQIPENLVEERSSWCAILEASLLDVLFLIIKLVNERKDHILQVLNLKLYHIHIHMRSQFQG